MQRALNFAKYLSSSYGWEPIVLTAAPSLYARTSVAQLQEVPEDLNVHRIRGLDSQRHLSLFGRYLSWTAIPDSWVTWGLNAAIRGRSLIKRYNPDLIWSTFPIPSTNLAASHIAKHAGIPWVADLRDPMTLDGYPNDPLRFSASRWIEQRTVDLASKIVFTAEFTRRVYEERYPQLAGRTLVISNGYSEASFGATLPRSSDKNTSMLPLTLVHSGNLQEEGRHPRSFFEALSRLKSEGAVNAAQLQIVFRDCEEATIYKPIAEELGIADLIEFKPYLPYTEAIQEMIDADGLLLFQGTAYNHAVPAKLYEYLRAFRPIFGIVDQNGETQSVANEIGLKHFANIQSSIDIAEKLKNYVSELQAGVLYVPELEQIKMYSRQEQTRKLDSALRQVLMEH